MSGILGLVLIVIQNGSLPNVLEHRQRCQQSHLFVDAVFAKY